MVGQSDIVVADSVTYHEFLPRMARYKIICDTNRTFGARLVVSLLRKPGDDYQGRYGAVPLVGSHVTIRS